MSERIARIADLSQKRSEGPVSAPSCRNVHSAAINLILRFITVENGPDPTLGKAFGFCVRSPHCRRSLHLRNLEVIELTVCGLCSHSFLAS
ncbi:hypothetical protein [Shimia sp.]|uniref:hypothetical protein n=1 Tax=Shimia sp. TaxID=1954381 RepID=UPI0032990645